MSVLDGVRFMCAATNVEWKVHEKNQKKALSPFGTNYRGNTEMGSIKIEEGQKLPEPERPVPVISCGFLTIGRLDQDGVWVHDDECLPIKPTEWFDLPYASTQEYA